MDASLSKKGGILKAQAAPGGQGRDACALPPGRKLPRWPAGEGRKLEALHDYLYNGIVKKRRKLALSASSALKCNLSFFPYPSGGVTGKKD